MVKTHLFHPPPPDQRNLPSIRSYDFFSSHRPWRGLACASYVPDVRFISHVRNNRSRCSGFSETTLLLLFLGNSLGPYRVRRAINVVFYDFIARTSTENANGEYRVRTPRRRHLPAVRAGGRVVIAEEIASLFRDTSKVTRQRRFFSFCLILAVFVISFTTKTPYCAPTFAPAYSVW